MALVDMARTAKEKKAQEEKYSSTSLDSPDYPYGLTINLGDDELKKLGIDQLPEVGDELHIDGMCKVTRVSASADESNKSRSVELQITHLGSMEPDEDDKPTAAKSLYPDHA